MIQASPAKTAIPTWSFSEDSLESTQDLNDFLPESPRSKPPTPIKPSLIPQEARENSDTIVKLIREGKLPPLQQDFSFNENITFPYCSKDSSSPTRLPKSSNPSALPSTLLLSFLRSAQKDLNLIKLSFRLGEITEEVEVKTAIMLRLSKDLEGSIELLETPLEKSSNALNVRRARIVEKGKLLVKTTNKILETVQNRLKDSSLALASKESLTGISKTLQKMKDQYFTPLTFTNFQHH